jgi:ATP-dependent helicase YprA (DUF1998 family)
MLGGEAGFSSNESPHKEFSLRGPRDLKCEAEWEAKEQVIEKRRYSQAMARLYPGAIFISHDSKGKVNRFDVTSLSLENQRATLVLSKYGPNFSTVVLGETRVSMKQLWEEKTFSVGDRDDAELQVSFGWGHNLVSIYGYELHEKDGDEITVVNSSTYEKRFERSYEAPCLLLSLNTAARSFVNTAMNDLFPPIRQKMTCEPELCERLEGLQTWEFAMVSVHTLLHQLIRVVPLLLLSTNDIDEGQLISDECGGFLVDTSEGGTGVCESIFRNFEQYVEKSLDFSSCCSYCDGEMGCAVCLYMKSCETWNCGLLTRAGLKLLNPRSQE